MFGAAGKPASITSLVNLLAWKCCSISSQGARPPWVPAVLRRPGAAKPSSLVYCDAVGTAVRPFGHHNQRYPFQTFELPAAAARERPQRLDEAGQAERLFDHSL